MQKAGPIFKLIIYSLRIGLFTLVNYESSVSDLTVIYYPSEFKKIVLCPWMRFGIYIPQLIFVNFSVNLSC